MSDADTQPENLIPETLLQQFEAIVGQNHAILPGPEMEPFLREWRDKYTGRAAIVLQPGTTEEVAEILKLANDSETPVVPQGGNTGLVGGQIPFDAGNEVIVSLARLNRVRKVDAAGNSMTLEAGVTLAQAQEAAEAEDRLFPLSLASEGSCQIGGNLSTNAGGTAVLAYGNMRELTLGLEVVLPDGRIWNGLRSLRKDNTGYDLRDLFIGAEGTLGIITAAVLKLFPKPLVRATAFCGHDSLADVARFFSLARERVGSRLTAFELLPRIGVEFAARHTEGVRDPLSAIYPWYTLVELSASRADAQVEPELMSILEAGAETGLVLDAAIAASLQQRSELWHMREMMSEVQKHEGGSIKHDVSVPVASIPEFIERGIALVKEIVPDCRPVPFGHFGDGNIHFNFSQPVGMDKQAYLARWDEVANAVHRLVVDMNGSISAEHGIGRMKRQMLADLKDPVEMDLMRKIKQTLDPNNIMNPGKVL